MTAGHRPGAACRRDTVLDAVRPFNGRAALAVKLATLDGGSGGTHECEHRTSSIWKTSIRFQTGAGSRFLSRPIGSGSIAPSSVMCSPHPIACSHRLRGKGTALRPRGPGRCRQGGHGALRALGTALGLVEIAGGKESRRRGNGALRRRRRLRILGLVGSNPVAAG